MAKQHLSKQAFLARMAAGRAKAAKKRGGKKHKRQVGKKRAKKVVKAVAKETRADAKKIKRVARKIAKKIIVRHHPMQTAVASAAKRVADKCAEELKSVRAKAEMALALGNIGRGMRHATHGGPQAKHIKGLKTRLSKLRAASRHATMGGAHVHTHPHKKHGKKGGHAIVHHTQTLHRMGKKHKRHAEEHGVTAAAILSGAKRKGKKVVKTHKPYNFWVCAGPVRTGCGHGGSQVLGDKSSHKAIRLRG
jgi:hypothetical protein